MLARGLTANIFEHDRELLAGVSAAEAAAVTSIREAEVMSHTPGPVEFELDHANGFGLLVLEGFLCRIAEVTERTSVELLGPGDLMRPWELDRIDAPVPMVATFRALSPIRLAVLDRDFVRAVAPWPGVAEAVAARLVARSRWLAFQLALTRERRIEDRLYMLLWQLADRWGEAVDDGPAVCAIPLSHDLLGGMIGAQRQTVTTAMSGLETERRIARRHDGWALLGEPPTATEREGRALADAFRLRGTD